MVQVVIHNTPWNVLKNLLRERTDLELSKSPYTVTFLIFRIDHLQDHSLMTRLKNWNKFTGKLLTFERLFQQISPSSNLKEKDVLGFFHFVENLQLPCRLWLDAIVRKENVIGHSLGPFLGACINPRYLAKTFRELSTSPCDLLLDAPITSTVSIEARGRPSLKLSWKRVIFLSWCAFDTNDESK